MNCKPGDLARVVHPTMYGHFVTVLEAAPNDKDFRLPDGQLHFPAGPNSWVCESLGPDFPALIKSNLFGVKPRMARFACIADKFLRPIRDPGDDAVDETLREREVTT